MVEEDGDDDGLGDGLKPVACWGGLGDGLKPIACWGGEELGDDESDELEDPPDESDDESEEDPLLLWCLQ